MRLLSAISEERLDDGRAVGGEDARCDFHAVIEAGVRKNFETGADRAAFGIVGAIDKSRDAGLDNRTGAHGAGLDGNIQGGTGEAIVTEQARALAEYGDFGVGRGVAIANRAIARTHQSLAVVDKDSANGHFAGLCCCAGFGERFLHELHVRFHLWRENSTRKEKMNTTTRAGLPDTASQKDTHAKKAA
jgi:hypothetical protein